MEKEDSIAEDEVNDFKDLEQETVGDKDNTEGFQEEDKISGVLLDQHGDVPLEDPGPNTATEDGVGGVAEATQ